jgi:transcriptional regulator with XRE-family HTH domain
MDYSEVGGRIKRLRKIKHLSTEAMATELNFSERHYKRIESGSITPSAELLIKVSKFFNVSIDFIIFGNKNTLIPDEIEQLVYKFHSLNKQGKQILLNLADDLYTYEKQIKDASK